MLVSVLLTTMSLSEETADKREEIQTPEVLSTVRVTSVITHSTKHLRALTFIIAGISPQEISIFAKNEIPAEEKAVFHSSMLFSQMREDL